ncbi:MAG: hypothetical protein ACK5NA_00685 [Enterococcus sp.]
MKKQVKREEVSELLVKDEFYEKNMWLKIRQSVIACIAWGGVILPFAWLFFVRKEKLVEGNYPNILFSKEVNYFNHITFYLVLFFLILLLFFIALTFWNNRQFKKKFQKRSTYDTKRVAERKALLEKAYVERFGSKEERMNVRYYSVKEEQNLATHFVQELYQKKQG